MNPHALRTGIGDAFVDERGPELGRDVIAHSPVFGRAPSVVVVVPGEPCGNAVLAAITERRIDLHFHELRGHRCAVAIVDAKVLPVLAALVDERLARNLERRVELPEVRLLVVAGGGAAARVFVLAPERVSA